MTDLVNKQARPEIFTLKPYIPGKPIDEVKRELGIDNIIKLASNENPLGAAPLAVQAIAENLDKMHLYPDGSCFNLKNRLAKSLNIDVNCILIGNGSDELLKMIAEAFLNPGDEVIYARPTFAEYEFAAKIMGAHCIEIALNNFKHDLNAMAEAVTDRTKLIFICNPNNPTATMVDQTEMEQFITTVPADVLVIIDEAYGEYVDSPDYPESIKYLRKGQNVIVLRTFSKIYGLAALRVGYALTRPALAQAIERVREPFNVNTLAQVAATAALDDTEHLQKSRKTNREGKSFLYSELHRLGLQYVPSQTNFILIDTGQDAQYVFQALLKQGVIVRSGDAFGLSSFIRVTVGTMEQNRRFIEALAMALGV